MEKYYLTTPLYYVNSKPHIGHSYTEIACDVLARWHRLTGKEVLFLTGTDEHGQKISKAAESASLSPQDFTDKISVTFRDLWKTLNISYDDFIRTTESRHKNAVAAIWDQIKGKKVGGEDILYRHTYDGFYCVSCETFIAEGLIEPGGPALCPDCKRPLERMKEDTYFFRMSAYQERLIRDIKQGDLRILPESRRNEVLGFLEHNKLADLSVSRPKNRLAWGIPIPFDPDHVTYVWFDALINYISAVGYGADDKKFNKWWPADVHVIGKDIIRHHAVIWPALLYALEIPLPKMVFAHGWWVQGGEKMSKSKGNVVDPVEIVKVYGVDSYRYFLLREAPFGEDGVFSEEALIQRFNSDLANNLGNLVSRGLAMTEKYYASVLPDWVELDPDSMIGNESAKLRQKAEALRGKVETLMGRLAFSEALTSIWEVVSEANRFIELSAPWALAKEKKQDELKCVLLTLLQVLQKIAFVVFPFMPVTAQSLWGQLGFSGDISDASFKDIQSLSGHKTAKGESLFPRIEVKK